MKKINPVLFSASLYVAFQLFANILSTKIAIMPLFNLAVDGGTIIYPFTFTLRDFVHKTLGKQNARTVVMLAALLNIIMAILFFIIGQLQPYPTWPHQAAYEAILLPVWRITIASIIAQVISELIDTEIFSVAYRKFGDIWGVLFSNTVSLAIDSVLFTVIAFVGNLPSNTLAQIIISNIAIKFILSIISIPTIKLVPTTVKPQDI